MRELLIGYDHGFGRQRAGNVERSRGRSAQRDGFRVDVVDAVSTPTGSRLLDVDSARVAGGDLDRARRRGSAAAIRCADASYRVQQRGRSSASPRSTSGRRRRGSFFRRKVSTR